MKEIRKELFHRFLVAASCRADRVVRIRDLVNDSRALDSFTSPDCEVKLNEMHILMKKLESENQRLISDNELCEELAQAWVKEMEEDTRELEQEKALFVYLRETM